MGSIMECYEENMQVELHHPNHEILQIPEWMPARVSKIMPSGRIEVDYWLLGSKHTLTFNPDGTKTYHNKHKGCFKIRKTNETYNTRN